MSTSEIDNSSPANDTLVLYNKSDLKLTPLQYCNSINNDDSLMCFFCSNMITNLESIDLLSQNPHNSSLDDFARLFKISTKTLFQGTHYESILANLHCATCSANINNAMRLLEKIENLQVNLDDIMNLLKCNLLKSYRSRSTSGGANKQEKKGVEFLQKTFIQCWSDCIVEVTPLEPLKKRQRRFKGIPGDSIVKNESSKDSGMRKISNKSLAGDYPDSIQLEDCLSPHEEIMPEMESVPVKYLKTKKKIKKYKKLSSERKDSTTAQEVKVKDYPFVCKTCGKGYYLKHYLNVHERIHSEGKSLSCNQCTLKFYCDRSLRLHQVKRHGMAKICRSETGRKSLRGYNKHRRLEWFVCRHCQKKFNSKEFITQDGKLRVISNDITETFDCFSEFRKHHFTHCQQKPTEETRCEMCEKDFTSGKMLEDHRTVFHTKEFPFYCEKCGVGKINKSALNKHMLVHTDAKNFQCQICLQSFKRNVQLKFHMMRHNNDLPFMCDLCGKRFTDKQKLKRHRETHSEEKKYPCPQCEKLFVSKNYVYHHIWDTHKQARRPKTSMTDTKEIHIEEEAPLTSELTTTTTVSFIGFSSNSNLGYQVPTEITFI